MNSAYTAKRRLEEVLAQDRLTEYLANHPAARRTASRNHTRLEQMDRKLRRARLGWPGYGVTSLQAGVAAEGFRYPHPLPRLSLLRRLKHWWWGTKPYLWYLKARYERRRPSWFPKT